MTRRYDSAVRRERAERTRERIVAAGAVLVHGFPRWDWRGLTFRAVAERAGVSERTVYRHFGSDRELREAVMDRLKRDAGVSYEGLDLDDLVGVAARIIATLPSFAVSSWSQQPADDQTFVAEDVRRRGALLAAVEGPAAGWPEADRQIAAAMLDVLWGVPAYERLMAGWGLDLDEATRGVRWVVELVVEALRTGRRPGPAGPAQAGGDAGSPG